MLTSHCPSILLAASVLVTCGGTTSPLSGVVFESSRKLDGTDAVNINGTRNIWRVNIDGTGLAPLTRTTGNGADSYAPQLSQDGSKVAFDSARNTDHNTSNIWRVNVDGTGLTPLTTAIAIGVTSSLGF